MYGEEAEVRRTGFRHFKVILFADGFNMEMNSIWQVKFDHSKYATEQ